MARTAGTTQDAPNPAGPYSQSVRAGNVVAAAGQGGVDPSSGTLVEGLEAQTRRAFRNVAASLEASGATLDDVVSVRVFLLDRADFAAMNEVYATVFSAPYPARTTVYVGLPEGMRIEVDALAVLEP